MTFMLPRRVESRPGHVVTEVHVIRHQRNAPGIVIACLRAEDGAWTCGACGKATIPPALFVRCRSCRSRVHRLVVRDAEGREIVYGYAVHVELTHTVSCDCCGLLVLRTRRAAAFAAAMAHAENHRLEVEREARA